MRRLGTIGMAFALGLAFAAPAAASCAIPSNAATLAADVGRMLNAERRRQGLPPLAASPGLQRAAQRQACDMAVNNVTSHRGSDGTTVSARVRAAGHCTRLVAENIAWGQLSPASAMSSWMSSSGHRRNILLSQVTAYGVAVAQPGPRTGGGPRWVMVLAKSC